MRVNWLRGSRAGTAQMAPVLIHRDIRVYSREIHPTVFSMGA